MTNLTPREIVSELDRFIIGQADAKRAVAVALRNRSMTASRSAAVTDARGWRSATCVRARLAICRTAGSDFSTASAISAYGTSKTSRSTNTARSVGVSVSSTVSIA